MAGGVYTWSQTASSNATADSTINWAEGQSPSSVNDSARAMMAALAKWRDDNSGALVTAGSSTAYTLATNQVFSSLSAMNGQTVRATMSATCGATPTLNVDSLGAKAIVYANGTAVGAGDLLSGSVHSFVYDNANTVWIVVDTVGSFPAGTIMTFQQTAAPTGWTKNTTHNDKALRIVSGTASTGGTSSFVGVFASRTIIQANLPSYTLPNTLAISDPGHVHANTVALPNGSQLTALVGTTLAGATTGTLNSATATTGITLTGTVTSGGSGTAMDFGVAYVDVILATKN